MFNIENTSVSTPAMQSEFTLENMTNSAISVSKISKNDRTADGNLLPEAKDKARKAFEKYVRDAGRINISELSRHLGLSRPTVRAIADEFLAEWRADIEDQAVVVHKWCEQMAREIDAQPENFDKDAIARIRLKMSLLDKMRVIRRVLNKGGE